jgi:cation/acetate symporter
MLTIIVVSLLTGHPEKEVQDLVEHVRYPHLRADVSTQAA